jgi:polyphenol oxidase
MSSASLRCATVPALSAIPGLVHGFEQRLGPPGWESREQTRARVSAALREEGRLLLMRQVHGTVVQEAPWEGTPAGDASVAWTPGLLLGIETADCLPVLLVDPVRRAVAAAHAGWRGTAACVAEAAVRALVALGSRPPDLLAALGPGIGPCCYEVGEELREAFGPEGAPFFRPGPRGRPHLDVRGVNRAQLVAAGVPPTRIHEVDACTCCRADLFHSYRREGRGAGRMISWVGFAASGPERG